MKGRPRGWTRTTPLAHELTRSLERRRWTYQQGAKFVGVPVRHFASWARGEYEPAQLTLEQEQKLCEFVHWQWLPGGLEKRKQKLPVTPLPLLADQGVIQIPSGPEEELLRVEREHNIQRLLTPQQALLVRCLITGQTYADLEIALTLTRAGINYRLQQALRRLRHPANARTLQALR